MHPSEHPTTWRFQTRSVPAAQRNAAWANAMRRLRLPFVSDPEGQPSDGRMTIQSSALGLQFARIESGRQVIDGRELEQGAGIWLLVLLKGNARFSSDGVAVDVTQNMIVYGATRHDSRLEVSEDNAILFVRIPDVALGGRLIAPTHYKSGTIDGSVGVGRMLLGMLLVMADELGDISTQDLPPVELALIELLTSKLLEIADTRSLGGAQGARAAHLHRIQQTLETLLWDPDLTIVKAADEVGVSPRYLQRLFAADGHNFSGYLKKRRLERCHADLISPLHAQESISEVAFRWGFSSSAHFSRSFREQFGLSPREHRRTGLANRAQDEAEVNKLWGEYQEFAQGRA